MMQVAWRTSQASAENEEFCLSSIRMQTHVHLSAANQEHLSGWVKSRFRCLLIKLPTSHLLVQLFGDTKSSVFCLIVCDCSLCFVPHVIEIQEVYGIFVIQTHQSKAATHYCLLLGITPHWISTMEASWDQLVESSYRFWKHLSYLRIVSVLATTEARRWQRPVAWRFW
jgi:hypothetical protein